MISPHLCAFDSCGYAELPPRRPSSGDTLETAQTDLTNRNRGVSRLLMTFSSIPPGSRPFGIRRLFFVESPKVHAGADWRGAWRPSARGYSTEGIGNGTFAVLLFAVEGLEVITGNDVMVADFTAPGFERAQNSLDARRRFRRPLNVEWFIVLTEYELRKSRSDQLAQILGQLD